MSGTTSSTLSSSDFTSFHMKCINRFRWSALTRTVISKDESGRYSVRPSPFFAQLVFYIYLVNTFGKLTFLVLLVTDHFGPIDFLDRICGLDYILCGGMVCGAYLIWRRYPLYEVIHRLWEIENRIYRKLQQPREAKWEAEERHAVTVWAHLLLCCLGLCSLCIQFYQAPKYCVFTYSLIEADNSVLRAVACFHEVLFLSHAWAAMGCSNGLCSFEAVNLSLLIKEMSKAVDELTQHQTFLDSEFSMGTTSPNMKASMLGGNEAHHLPPKDNNSFMMKGDTDNTDTPFRYANEESYGTTTQIVNSNGDANESRERSTRSRMMMKRFRNSSSRSLFGSGLKSYSFQRILYDYQQLMLASEQFNAWVSYKIVGLSICAFCQYISSTTMAFQVLRMEGTGIGDIWFYIQDCAVATYVTFRVFDFMSIVLPASEQFLCSVRRYVAMKGIVGGHIRKFQRTLRPVSLKIGPNPMRRETVLNTMDMLANYYVCVALW